MPGAGYVPHRRNVVTRRLPAHRVWRNPTPSTVPARSPASLARRDEAAPTASTSASGRRRPSPCTTRSTRQRAHLQRPARRQPRRRERGGLPRLRSPGRCGRPGAELDQLESQASALCRRGYDSLPRPLDAVLDDAQATRRAPRRAKHSASGSPSTHDPATRQDDGEGRRHVHAPTAGRGARFQ
jgi:hypothetical protein